MINFIKQMLRIISIVLISSVIGIGSYYITEFMTLQALNDLGIMFILTIFVLIGVCLFSWAWED